MSGKGIGNQVVIAFAIGSGCEGTKKLQGMLGPQNLGHDALAGRLKLEFSDERL